MTGIAQIEGGADGAHGGILVEAEATRYSTVTTSDGRYALPMPERDQPFTLRFSRDGYTTATESVPGLAANEEIEVRPVTLSGQPGHVIGRVRLNSDWGDAEAVRSVDAALVELPFIVGDCVDDTACDHNQICHQNVCYRVHDRQTPAPDGDILFTTAAGAYRLIVRLDGFYPESRDAFVRVGEDTSVGQIELWALPATAIIAGTAQLGGAADHSGIVVELADSPLMAETNSDGLFALGVPARAEGYTLRVRRPGYDVGQREVPGLAPGALHELAEPVVLGGQPGSLRGVVRIDEDFDAHELMPRVAVRVSVIESGEGGATRLVASGPPGADGVYVFDGVAADRYVVEIGLEGFVTAWHSATVGVGDDFRDQWIAYRPFLAITLAGDDGSKRIVVRVRDRAGHESESSAEVRVRYDTTAPSGAVTIIGPGGDEAWARRPNVTLGLTLTGDDAADKVEMRVAGGDDLAGAVWQPYVEALPWTLSGPDGIETVRVEYRDAAGNRSDPMSDEIELDTAAPATPGGVLALAGNRTVRLRWGPVVEDLDHYRVYYGTDSARVRAGTSDPPVTTWRWASTARRSPACGSIARRSRAIRASRFAPR